VKQKQFRAAQFTTALFFGLTASELFAQGFLAVDQASGTTDELVQVFTLIPDNQIAQSFTPSLSAVGFVQFQTVTFQDNNGAGVVVAVNLRQGAYNGSIISSTTPLVIVRGPIQIGTFYFPEEVPVIPGQRYFFEPVLLSAGNLDIGTKSPSPYLGGDLWSNGLMDPQADLWFREGIMVPEPDTIWLLLFGGGVFIWRWRVGNSSGLRFWPTRIYQPLHWRALASIRG